MATAAVGAHFINSIIDTGIGIYYWREGVHEVDFVLQKGKEIIAVEVKSGQRRRSVAGITEFCKQYPEAKPLLIGGEGMALDTFFQSDITAWFSVS